MAIRVVEEHWRGRHHAFAFRDIPYPVHAGMAGRVTVR